MKILSVLRTYCEDDGASLWGAMKMTIRLQADCGSDGAVIMVMACLRCTAKMKASF